MEIHVVKVAVPTAIIRTPATGPKPANTLVFLRCRAAGGDIGVFDTDLLQFDVRFKSQFQIDGYLQAQHEWFVANTRVTATGMLRVINTTTDIEFVVGIDSVLPFIDLDGILGFQCRFGMQIDGLGLFGGTPELEMTCDVAAYVLLYEPRTELPKSGKSRQRWALGTDELERRGQLLDQLSTRLGARPSVSSPRPRKQRLRPEAGKARCVLHGIASGAD